MSLRSVKDIIDDNIHFLTAEGNLSDQVSSMAKSVHFYLHHNVSRWALHVAVCGIGRAESPSYGFFFYYILNFVFEGAQKGW